jgi:hypothetical protein
MPPLGMRVTVTQSDSIVHRGPSTPSYRRHALVANRACRYRRPVPRRRHRCRHPRPPRPKRARADFIPRSWRRSRPVARGGVRSTTAAGHNRRPTTAGRAPSPGATHAAAATSRAGGNGAERWRRLWRSPNSPCGHGSQASAQQPAEMPDTLGVQSLPTFKQQVREAGLCARAGAVTRPSATSPEKA